MDLKPVQKPLKEQYRNDPSASQITLKAKGGQTETPIACSVAIGRALYRAEAHPGVGILHVDAHADLRVAMDENGDSTLVWRATVGEAHLGLLRQSRLDQASVLLKMHRELAPMPTILMGDFNEWRGRRRSELVDRVHVSGIVRFVARACLAWMVGGELGR